MELPYEDPNRISSKFWGSGKWKTFIEPLLRLHTREFPFVEIGSNAGLFLKKAEDYGYRRVIGIEANRDRLREAELFKQANGGKYEIRGESVGGSYNPLAMPVAGMTLIANTHYYFTVANFSKLVDILRFKTLYCLVVSAHVRTRSGNPSGDLDALRGYFRDWREIAVIENISEEGDPSPRAGMYGILFRSALRTIKVRPWAETWRNKHKNSKNFKYRDYASVYTELMDNIINNRGKKPKELEWYSYWQKRRPDLNDAWIDDRYAYMERLMNEIKTEGINEPVYIRPPLDVKDGLKRIVIADYLGYKRIIYRPL